MDRALPPDACSLDGRPIALSGEKTVLRALQDKSLRVSWKREVRAELRQIFTGREYEPVLAECDRIHARVLKRRVFVALHLHAGDGNVHVRLNSDDYEIAPRQYTGCARRVLRPWPLRHLALPSDRLGQEPVGAKVRL